MENVLASVAVIGTSNLFGFFITAVTLTHKITDLVGTGSFFVAIWMLAMKVESFSTSQITILFLVSVWSIRLASFLFYRVLSIGTDARLNGFFIKSGESWLTAPKYFPMKLLGFWFLQFLWGVLVLLPVTVSYRKLNDFSINEIVFALSALFGFLWESIADIQKSFHKSSSDSFCDNGLWAFSKHPNYFGELFFWWSIYFYCLPSLLGYENFVVIGPIFISILLLFVSGIPLAEKNWNRKFGKLEAFRTYQKNTSLLIPWFPASAKKE